MKITSKIYLKVLEKIINMITIKKHRSKHQIISYWNKYAKGEQFSWIECDVFLIYFLGMLIFKRVSAVA